MFPWPHKILVKTIGEMSVHILGYTNAMILWMIVFGYKFKTYLMMNVIVTWLTNRY
jgi:hypothetical protein